MNYRTAVYFYSINYRTSLKFCTITSHKLNGSFRYFYRMLTKICLANHVSLALLSLSVVESLRNGFCTLPFFKATIILLIA